MNSPLSCSNETPQAAKVFAKGGHGFGMKKQNLPTDGWVERLADWLGHQGLLKK